MQEKSELLQEESIAIIIDMTEENEMIRIGQRYSFGEISCLITHIESVAFITKTTLEICVNVIFD